MYRWLAVSLWIAACGSGLSAQADEPLPKVLLITGLGTADPDHPKHILSHQFYNGSIVKILGGIAEVTVTEDLGLLNAGQLESYELVLNNSFLLEPSPAELQALFEFIEAGGSYMTLHAGLESFVNSERYVRMMGGRLAGHSPQKVFTVETFEDGFGVERTQPWAHPITRGVPVFETNDELYVVQTNTDELEVIARAESHPIVWWRPWRNGTVLAFTLGHAPESIENAGYQALLRNSVRWLLGYPLIESSRPIVVASDAGVIEGAINLRQKTHIRGKDAIAFEIHNDRPDLVVAEVDEHGGLRLHVHEEAAGLATLTVRAATSGGRASQTELVIDVRKPGTGNLASYYNVVAHSSASEPRYATASPRLVHDADASTRWSSQYVDDAWIYLDLRSSYLIDRVRLLWQGAYATEYEIQISDDAQAWTTVRQVKGRGGIERISFAPTQGRFIRVLASRRATRYGYSLFEFEVFGQAN